jgi:branched-chain amino acid transport system substrate-binding protein
MGGVLSGRPVQLVVQDDMGTPAEGVAGYRRLVQKEGVSAILGLYHSSVSLAVIEASKELGVPVFATFSSAAKITESGYPTVFRILGLTEDRIDYWMDHFKKAGIKRVAQLCEDSDYGTEFDKGLKEFGMKAGLEIQSSMYPRTATDMTPSLLKVKAWKPDLFINSWTPPGAYLVAKQAYDIGLFPQVPMLAAYDWPVRPEYWDAVGDKGKYIMFTAYYKPGMPVTKLGEWLIPRYKSLHNEDAQFVVLNAYGNTLIIAQTINAAKSDDPKAIIKALTSTTFNDWNGTVKFGEQPGVKWHHVSPPLITLQLTKVKQSLADTKVVWPPNLGGDGKIERP